MTISVELIDKMGKDLTVVNAARVSFDKQTDTLRPQDVGLIKFLTEECHTMPFRHPHLQFRCEVPLFLAAQLKKHQTGMSWSEISRRYVSTPPDFHVSEFLRLAPEGNIKQGSSEETIHYSNVVLEDWFSIDLENFMEMSQDFYQQMVKQGIAPEIIRTFMPQNMQTTFIWTGSLLSFFNVYKQRIDGHAQVEAQEFAKQLDSIISEVFPVSWNALKKAAAPIDLDADNITTRVIEDTFVFERRGKVMAAMTKEMLKELFEDHM